MTFEATPAPKSLDPVLRRMVYGQQVGPDHLIELMLIAEIDLAHTTMLWQSGLLSSTEAKSLRTAVEELRAEGMQRLLGRPLERGLYMLYEGFLEQCVGPEVAGKVHLGRSRNDLNATVFRMRMRQPYMRAHWCCLRLLSSLCDVANAQRQRMLPHQTHSQTAFPISVGHYFGAIAASLAQNIAWLSSGVEAIDVCPLGAGAGAGTSIPIDPQATARLLGFTRPLSNSLEAVANRDLGLRVISALAVASVDLDRLCSDLMLWVSSGYQYANLPDHLVGASSMLPQKRNPFVLEHVRSWLRSTASAASAMCTATFGTSYTNSIEAGTEASTQLWPAMARFSDACTLLRRVVLALNWDDARMDAAATAGHVTAFIAAEDLARSGVPFREAHGIVSSVVGGRQYKRVDLAAPSPPCLPTASEGLSRLQFGGGAADDAAHTAASRALRSARDHAVREHRVRHRRWSRASTALRAVRFEDGA